MAGRCRDMADIYPSDSASTKTSSPSSPAGLSWVEDKGPVDVVTIGTDWEAGSEASEVALSVNTLTVERDTASAARGPTPPSLRASGRFAAIPTWGCHLQGGGRDTAATRLFFMSQEEGRLVHAQT